MLPAVYKDHNSSLKSSNSFHSSRSRSFSSNNNNNNNSGGSHKKSVKSRPSNFRFFPKQNSIKLNRPPLPPPEPKIPPARKRISTSLRKNSFRPLNFSMPYLLSKNKTEDPNNESHQGGRLGQSLAPLIGTNLPVVDNKQSFRPPSRSRNNKKMTIMNKGKNVSPQFLMSSQIIKNKPPTLKTSENTLRVRTKSNEYFENSDNIKHDQSPKSQTCEVRVIPKLIQSNPSDSSSSSTSSSSTSSSTSLLLKSRKRSRSNVNININIPMIQRSRTQKRSFFIGYDESNNNPIDLLQKMKSSKNLYQSQDLRQRNVINNQKPDLVYPREGQRIRTSINLADDFKQKQNQALSKNSGIVDRSRKNSRTLVESSSGNLSVKRSQQVKITQILGELNIKNLNIQNHPELQLNQKQILGGNEFNTDKKIKIRSPPSSFCRRLLLPSHKSPKIMLSKADTLPAPENSRRSILQKMTFNSSSLLAPKSRFTLEPRGSMRSISQAPTDGNDIFSSNKLGSMGFNRIIQPRRSHFFNSRTQGLNVQPEERRVRQKTEIVKERDSSLFFSSLVTNELSIKKEVDYNGIENSEQINEYSLCDLLGQGAYASVYKAISLKDRQLYVIFNIIFNFLGNQNH